MTKTYLGTHTLELKTNLSSVDLSAHGPCLLLTILSTLSMILHAMLESLRRADVISLSHVNSSSTVSSNASAH